MEVDSLIELGQALIGAIFLRTPILIAEARRLIAEGAPLWYQDDGGNSALHAAAYVGNSELVRLLIDEGAVWNAGKREIFAVTWSCNAERLSDFRQSTTSMSLRATLHYLSTMRPVTLSSEMLAFGQVFRILSSCAHSIV